MSLFDLIVDQTDKLGTTASIQSHVMSETHNHFNIVFYKKKRFFYGHNAGCMQKELEIAWSWY